MAEPTYELLIDWSGDGVFVGPGEDVSADLREAAGITLDRGRDAARQLAQPMAGTFGCALDNYSRAYSPDNAAGPLYGNIIPGRLMDFSVVYNATRYPMLRGVVSDLTPDPAGRTLGVSALGRLARLVETRVSTPLYSNILVSTAIGHLLDAAGWPAGDRIIGTAKTTLRYWWLDDRDAFEALAELVNTEGPGAALYEDGRGRLVFEHRHYRILAARSNTAQATFRDQDNGVDPVHVAPFGYDPGLHAVYNDVNLKVNVRATAALAPIWELGQALTLPPYGSTALIARAEEPFTGAVTPAAGTDYAVTAGALASLSLSRASGPSTTLYIAAGAAGVTLTGLRLRARLLTRSEVTVEQTIDTGASRAKFGRRTYDHPIWPEIDPNVAMDFANAIAGAYQQPRPSVSLTVPGDEPQTLAVLQREVSDRVRIVEYQTGLDADFHIERIALGINEAGIVATLGCERAPFERDYALWGYGRWGASVWGY